MTGKACVVQRPERIELTQRMPWLSLLCGAVALPIIVMAVDQKFHIPQDVRSLFSVGVVAASLLALIIAIRFATQAPIIVFQRKTGTLIIPRLAHLRGISTLQGFALRSGSCNNGEGSRYTVSALVYSDEQRKTATIYVTQRHNSLRETWAEFCELTCRNPPPN